MPSASGVSAGGKGDLPDSDDDAYSPCNALCFGKSDMSTISQSSS